MVTSIDPQFETSADGTINNDTVLSSAAQSLDRFVAAIRDVPYEEKGVFFSEMLFVYAAAGADSTGPVLESGRARGQSTCVLGRIFPESKIVSVEFDRDSPDAPVAEERLISFDHVELLYGDSQKLLFKHLKPNAVIVIDGPKGFRALRLALQLLRTGKTRMVFVHDTYKGLATRRFLERHVPGVMFSDHESFVEKFRDLDEPCWKAFDRDGALEWQPVGVQQPSYGPTFACLPYNANVSYGRILMQLHLANFLARTGKTFSKKLPSRGGA